MDGGVAKDTEASDFGTVNVYSGGVASNTTLLNYGYMGVSSGGSAHEVSVTAAGISVQRLMIHRTVELYRVPITPFLCLIFISFKRILN